MATEQLNKQEQENISITKNNEKKVNGHNSVSNIPVKEAKIVAEDKPTAKKNITPKTKVTAKPTEKKAEPKPTAKKTSKKIKEVAPVLKSHETKLEKKPKAAIKKTVLVATTKLIFQ